MRTRAERRDLNKRKWISLLNKIYGDPFWAIIGEKGKVKRVKSFNDLKDSRLGRLMKNTRTLGHNFRVFHSPYNKDFRKRDIANKKIPENQIEEAEESMCLYAFESYCGNCDRFDTEECPLIGKVFAATKHKDVKCDKFID